MFNIFSRKKEKELPHDIYPDILFWEIGDNIKFYRHYKESFNWDFNLYLHRISYEGCSTDGVIWVIDEKAYSQEKKLYSIKLKFMVEHGNFENISLKNRRANKEYKEMINNNSYMELMSIFDKLRKEM